MRRAARPPPTHARVTHPDVSWRNTPAQTASRWPDKASKLEKLWETKVSSSNISRISPISRQHIVQNLLVGQPCSLVWIFRWNYHVSLPRHQRKSTSNPWRSMFLHPTHRMDAEDLQPDLKAELSAEQREKSEKLLKHFKKWKILIMSIIAIIMLFIIGLLLAMFFDVFDVIWDNDTQNKVKFRRTRAK